MRVHLFDANSYITRHFSTRLVEQGHTVATNELVPTLDYSTLLNHDVLIFDLNNVEKEDQIINILTFLKEQTLENPLIVVGISTLLTWNQTMKNSKKTMKESNWKVRKSSLKYKNVRALETALLSSQKDNLYPYVVAPGILYGGGEQTLHSLFQTAWLNNDEAGLPIIGDGKNNIPMIHVYDLCTIVRNVLDAPPPQQYICAVDPTHITQKQVIQAIANGLANGKSYNVDKMEEEVLIDKEGNTEALLADMRFESEYLSTISIEWHSEAGFVDNFDNVRQEFVAQRKLKPVRIAVYGPPGSGKTHYASKLSKHYYIPHLKIKDMIDEALLKNDEMAERIKANLAESAAALKTKKKKTKAPTSTKAGKKAAPEMPEYDVPRISSYLLCKLVKAKLRTPTIRNKGYVLDGFPRTNEEVLYLFGPDLEEDDNHQPIHLPIDTLTPTDGDEDVDESGAAVVVPPQRDPTTMVDSVIVLNCSENIAKQRLKALTASSIIEGHNDESGFDRRWLRYTLINDLSAETVLSPVAALSDVEVLDVPELTTTDEAKTMELMQIYIEKKGKAYNYHPTPEEIAAKLEEENRVRQIQEATKQQEVAAQEQQEAVERETITSNLQLRRQAVQVEDELLVEACSLPIRNYLMSNVIPALIDGLLDVCRNEPDDPVDHLAEYLFRYSVDQPQDKQNDQDKPTIKA